MSDPAARVRLVRCPNCQNLLPELAAYSVYSCGGCGTVLRANTGGFPEETISEKSVDIHNSFNGSEWEDDIFSIKSGKQKIILENNSDDVVNNCFDSNRHDVHESRRTRKAYEIRRNQNLGVDHVKYSDGSSSGYHQINTSYQNEYKEQNPSELLLRKLDELKDQINRSYQLQEKAKENVPYMHRLHHTNRHNETFEYNRQSAPRNMMLPSSGRRCLPISGGSPFVTCYNCSELLQVPRKVLFLEKTRKKMQCGSCLVVLLLEIVNKRLVISSCEQSHVMNEDSSRFNLSSDDYDHIHYTNGNPNSSSRVHAYSMDHKESDRVEKIPVKIKPPPPPPPKGSPLQDYFEYSNVYRTVEKFDDGNQRGLSEEASLATEIDVSFEYTNTGTSQESGGSRTSSLFAGFKKSIRDFSKSSHGSDQETINVVVNGRAISDRLVRKAEKLAGPIQPGNYWYDFRAGFWGVRGGPCLGIIPPFIEELNHPLEGNCAGGETGVFVNGRELHPKDFNLLCSRGLPRETNRSYIIEMSGRVLDETSGEELESLGSLAPTVQKIKRGFGMKPRIVAA
ncbi:uncharacterized protein LOC124914998 [Impatiens glandulifera]|uniref:uncharacterized protein LOC124914998 n=1 Tax=Impatiens glandulifera TaxID=253017 RepID=UPI001FB16AAD|nr:uncharacterized protein LOC124914998 [Impatiens glandulifera]